MAKPSLAAMARAEIEMRRRRVEVMSQISDESIPEHMTFRQWCQSLADRGLKVDGKPFNLDNRAALVPIYDAIPTTKKDAENKILVLMKATQIGITITEILANIYLSLKFSPVTIGMFMPSQSVAIHKSEHRFMRIVRSAPILYNILTMGRDINGSSKKIGEGNVLTRRIGESLMVFLWTTGKVTTESIPMDIVTLDEVQEMTLDQIDKVRARTGDSDIQFTMMLSTANMPDSDIDFWYQQGSQSVWHTECPHCKTLSDLSDPSGIFPDKSITYNSGQFDGAPIDYVWTCPECGGLIVDPQIGKYISHNPGADKNVISFMIPRTVSPRITPRQMFEGWARAKTGHQKKSFYNRTLARPFIDAEQLPVTMVHCLAAADAGIAYGLKWESSGKETYMGIDQMGSFNAVIIKKRLPDGRQAVIWVEAIFDLDPFEKCATLMEQYNVAVCVVEQLPNVNDARRFMNRFPGRVFLAGYGVLPDDMMQWGDDISKSDRKTNDEDRSRYTVTLNQYKCMQTALFRIRDRACIFPDPSTLEQDVIDDGKKKRILILRDWVFLHFTKIALVVEQKEDERKPRGKVLKVGIDPHYAYANMLCDVAWARSHGTSTFILPEEHGPAPTIENMPGLPGHVVSDIVNRDFDVCGTCSAFNAETSRCNYYEVRVKDIDPACSFYL